MYLPAPNGIFDEMGFVLSLVSGLSSSLLPLSTVIWLLTDVVLTIVGLAVVSVQVVVPVVCEFRNNKIDGDLSMRLRVCNKIGPSLVPFLFKRCWSMIDPSGNVVAVVAPVTVVVPATDVRTVADAFDVVAFFKACDECNSVLAFMPFPLNVEFNEFASMIWLFVILAFFNADWITNLLVSFDVCFWVGAIVFANDVFVRCNRIDGELDVMHVVLSSSPLLLLLLILTAPLFNKLNKSWPFCRIIWPFSVRAPRIRIILLGCWWCCCCNRKRGKNWWNRTR